MQGKDSPREAYSLILQIDLLKPDELHTLCYLSKQFGRRCLSCDESHYSKMTRIGKMAHFLRDPYFRTSNKRRNTLQIFCV
uniref:Uncharacterized protein n=1 Tax=Anopheles dirus TaxID=7168 RepID=A0A182NYV8_9DIPT